MPDKYNEGYTLVDLLLYDVDYFFSQEDALYIAEIMMAVYEQYRNMEDSDCINGGYDSAKSFIDDYVLEHGDRQNKIMLKG